MTAATPLPLLRAALAAAGRGWPVFPLIPGGKRPAITGWPHQATVDADVLAVWWRVAPTTSGSPADPPVCSSSTSTARRGRSQLHRPGRRHRAGADVHGRHALRRRAPLLHRRTRRTGAVDGRPGWDRRSTPAAPAATSSVPARCGRTGRRRRYYRVIDRRPPAAASRTGSPRRLRPPAPAPAPRIAATGAQRLRAGRRGRGVRAWSAQARPGTRNTVLFQAAVRLGTLVGAGVLDQQRRRTTNCGRPAPSTVESPGSPPAEAERAIANGLRYGQARPRPFQER